MKFLATKLPGVFEIEAAATHDARGFFARLYCPEAFAKAGIAFQSTQINLSRNLAPFTLRGMHWQDAPFAEAKLVRVTSGAAYDVVVDIRPHSPTFRHWIACHLDAERANALFIPEGCAHGFLTLAPNTDLLYQMGRTFVPGHASGFRWDDPSIAITWPALPAVISPEDLAWPSLWNSRPCAS